MKVPLQIKSGPQLTANELLELELDENTIHTKIIFDHRQERIWAELCGIRCCCICLCTICCCAPTFFCDKTKEISTRKAAVTATHLVYQESYSPPDRIYNCCCCRPTRNNDKYYYQQNKSIDDLEDAVDDMLEKRNLCAGSCHIIKKASEALNEIWKEHIIEKFEEVKVQKVPLNLIDSVSITKESCSCFHTLKLTKNTLSYGPYRTHTILNLRGVDNPQKTASLIQSYQQNIEIHAIARDSIKFMLYALFSVVIFIFIFQTPFNIDNYEFIMIIDGLLSLSAFINAFILLKILKTQFKQSHNTKVSRSNFYFGLMTPTLHKLSILTLMLIMIYSFYRGIFIVFGNGECLAHAIMHSILTMLITASFIMLNLIQVKEADHSIWEWWEFLSSFGEVDDYEWCLHPTNWFMVLGASCLFILVMFMGLGMVIESSHSFEYVTKHEANGLMYCSDQRYLSKLFIALLHCLILVFFVKFPIVEIKKNHSNGIRQCKKNVFNHKLYKVLFALGKYEIIGMDCEWKPYFDDKDENK
eukprot:524809_1